MLAVIPISSVLWFGIACDTGGQPDPEATVADAAEVPQTKAQPTWKDCMEHEDCIVGARVQVTKVDGKCQARARPWFEADTGSINVYSKGRVFFLVQWEERCKRTEVFLKHKEGKHPWQNDCHVGAWRWPGPESFTLVPCEVVNHTHAEEYLFCLETALNVECTKIQARRTGGSVRVRGSGGEALPPPDAEAEEPLPR
jgi:hypothetical protein